MIELWHGGGCVARHERCYGRQQQVLDLEHYLDVRGGVRAKLTCVDPKKLDRGYAGRDFDAAFIADLPGSVDPCGENGEFHTFVYEVPAFSSLIQVERGEIVERDGFVFTDVL
ncbi:MAG: hypothetical protein JWP08_1531 [Bryobacterales bacterium]|nr:hypothetical protein [Bryobacterales bacterium]